MLRGYHSGLWVCQGYAVNMISIEMSVLNIKYNTMVIFGCFENYPQLSIADGIRHLSTRRSDEFGARMVRG